MAYNIQLKTINSIANFITANGGILLTVFKHDDEYAVLSMRLDSPYAKKEYLRDTIVSEFDEDEYRKMIKGISHCVKMIFTTIDGDNDVVPEPFLGAANGRIEAVEDDLANYTSYSLIMGKTVKLSDTKQLVVTAMSNGAETVYLCSSHRYPKGKVRRVKTEIDLVRLAEWL